MLEGRRIVIRDENVIEILKTLKALEYRRVINVVETSMLYYARYLEENPDVEEVLYDSKKVNSEEELVNYINVDYVNLDCSEMNDEELRLTASRAMDAYLDGKRIGDVRLKKVLEEEFTRMKFSQYPPMDIERRDRRIESTKKVLVLRLMLGNRKVLRMIDYANTKTSYYGELIERAVKYYIKLLKSDSTIIDCNLIDMI